MKFKNSEGFLERFQRNTQRILIYGANVLSLPFHYLMKLIYNEKKVAKTIPVYKSSGSSKNIQNYRPIANPCSSSKVFEKLILKRKLDIQDAAKINLT